MQPLGDLSIIGFGFRPAVRAIVSSACTAFGVGEQRYFDTPGDFYEALEFYDPDVLLMETTSRANDPANALLRQIRYGATTNNPYLPMIAVSPHGSKQDVIQAINLGYHEFLVLPLSADRLWKALTHTAFVGRPFVDTATYFGPCRRRRNDPRFKGSDRRKSTGGGARRDQEERMDKIASTWEVI